MKIVPSNDSLRIETCGGIASGKTTLCRLLEKLQLEPNLENFQSNPFWRAFYANPTWHAFETEVTFLLQHFHEIKVRNAAQASFVCDYSLLLDLAYADVTLSGRKKDLFVSLHQQLMEEIPTPDILIYLSCSPETQLERIRQRGRDVENSIGINYLHDLNHALEKRVVALQNDVHVLLINSEEKNFKSDSIVQTEILTVVQESLEMSKIKGLV